METEPLPLTKYEIGRIYYQQRIVHLEQIIQSLKEEPGLELRRLDFMEEQEVCRVKLNYLDLKEIIDHDGKRTK